MHDLDAERPPRAGPRRPRSSGEGGPPVAGSRAAWVLGLQRQAGNKAVQRLLDRQDLAARPAVKVQRRPAPYIKKVKVHLEPPQSAELEWKGTPPSDAPGSDSFTVSTGKGYGDPGDPPGTCKRSCCKDPDKQCAPPWNQPGKVGACCTYYGDSFWTGKPEADHGGWHWWTPIQPYYSARHIALHQHHEVTGKPIGHGCVRMDEENAKRIADFSNGRRTNVTIDGRAAPVKCDADRTCASAASGGASARAQQAATPGLEGQLS